MADTSSIIVLDQTDALDIGSADSKREVLRRIINRLRGYLGGSKVGGGIQLFADGAAAKPAIAHIKLVTCAADTVIEVNGAPFTAIAGTVVTTNDEFDIDGTDAADAADLSRAINASTHANIYKVVKAVNPLKDILTPSTAIAGDTFKVTLADGVVHQFVGVAGTATSGAKTFSIDTSNAATAASIVAQVAAYTPFANKLTAIDGTTVVTFRSLDGNTFTLSGTASTLAESGGGVVTVSAYQKGALGNGLVVKTLGVVAKAKVTVASINANDTITVNGQTFTSKQQRGTGTLTAATAIAGTTFVLNGYTFTGAAGAVTLGAQTFSIDTGNTETATSIAAQINGFSKFSGILTATSASDVVTIRAVTAGTGGNSITLVGTVTVLAASAATLEGGIAVVNNEFEAKGTDTQIATDFVRALHASTTALANRNVRATSSAGVVTLWSKVAGTRGNDITIATSNGTRLAITGSLARLGSGTDLAFEGAAATGTLTLASVANTETCTVNGVVLTAHTNTDANDQFRIDGATDTDDAASLVKAINNSTTAGLKSVFATNASAVVTVTARRGGFAGNNITLAGGQASIVASVTRLTTGALPTSVVITNNSTLSLTNGTNSLDNGTGGAVSVLSLTT